VPLKSQLPQQFDKTQQEKILLLKTANLLQIRKLNGSPKHNYDYFVIGGISF